MSQSRTRGLALIAMAISISCFLVVLTDFRPIAADDPWPTPPPGPRAPVPRVIGLGEITPVEVSNVSGVARWVVLPLSSFVPRFPPVPSSSYQASDGVGIVSDAGSIISTIQLVYRPLPIEEGSSPGPRQELRKLFELGAYDDRANPISLDLRRPWVLDVPIRGLLQTFEDPARLLIARYDEDRGWVPLVTSYHQNRGILQALVLKVGRFAVLAEPRLISG